MHLCQAGAVHGSITSTGRLPAIIANRMMLLSCAIRHLAVLFNYGAASAYFLQPQDSNLIRYSLDSRRKPGTSFGPHSPHYLVPVSVDLEGIL